MPNAPEWLNTLFGIVVALAAGSLFFLVPAGISYLIFNRKDIIERRKKKIHCCKNCHFLIKKSPQLPVTTWDETDRKEEFPSINIPPGQLKHDGWGGYQGFDMDIGCHKIFWTEPHNELRDRENDYRKRKIHDEITLNRKEDCFFIPYREGMPMENAEELFSSISENRRNNKRIMWAFLPASLSLVLSLLSICLHYMQYLQAK